MQLQELYAIIELPAEAVRRLEAVAPAIALSDFEEELAGMMDIATADAAYRRLSARLTGDADHWAMLLCQLECARRDADRYRALGAGMDVFAATMKCYTRFLRECAVRNGRMFFDRGWWTYRQLSMRIFRLGALEYELREEGGAPCAGIHIPSDADLSPAAVDDSLAPARRRADLRVVRAEPDEPRSGGSRGGAGTGGSGRAGRRGGSASSAPSGGIGWDAVSSRSRRGDNADAGRSGSSGSSARRGRR